MNPDCYKRQKNLLVLHTPWLTSEYLFASDTGIPAQKRMSLTLLFKYFTLEGELTPNVSCFQRLPGLSQQYRV